MISVASTLLLVSLVFGTVPSAWAAPVGTRNIDVKSMRRVDTRELTGMRREHHSATSVVPRDDDIPVPVVARAGAPGVVSSDPDTAVKTSKPTMRRHHARNEERGADAKPRAMPRFKRDAVPRREREVVARKEDATSSNVARKDENVERRLFHGTATPGGGVHGNGKLDAEKRDVHDPAAPATHEGVKREPSGGAVIDGVKDGGKSGPAKREGPATDPAEPSTSKVAARDHRHESKKDCGEKQPPTQTPDAPTKTPDASTTNAETKRDEVKEVATQREEKLIKPIAIFRRALAFEDLD